MFRRARVHTVVAVDETCAIEGVYRRGNDGLFTPAGPHGTQRRRERCRLAIPPGRCVVRHLELSQASSKEMVQAVTCFAQGSLLLPFEDGYTDVRVARHGALSTAALFWCEKAFLDNCLATATAAGFMVCGFIVPELSLGDRESCLLYYETTGAQVLCHASPQSAPMVQSSTGGSPQGQTLFTATAQEIRRLELAAPKTLYVWQEDQGSDTDLLALQGNDRDAEVIFIHGWPDILPFLSPRHQTGPPPFEACLLRDQQQPLDGRGYVKMAAALGVTLMVLAAFMSTLYTQRKTEVLFLEKQAAQITRASQKAAKATQLIRKLQEKNRTIRKFVEEKPYGLELLKIIADATAMESRLDSVSITRDGGIVINGLSKDAAYATAFVKKLEESARITQCRLTTLEHMTDEDEYKFTIQARSREWADFFQEDRT